MKRKADRQNKCLSQQQAKMGRRETQTDGLTLNCSTERSYRGVRIKHHLRGGLLTLGCSYNTEKVFSLGLFADETAVTQCVREASRQKDTGDNNHL